MKRGFGKELRKLILSSTSIQSIHDFLHTKVFRDALNYTCILRLRRAQAAAAHQLNYSEGAKLDSETKPFSQSKLTATPWVFRFGDDEALVERVRTGSRFRKLHELARGVSEGIVTARNDVLLIPSDEKERLHLEDAFLKKCVRGEDVKRFSLRWGGFYVFYPYCTKNASTEVVDEDTLIEGCPNLYRYLTEHREQLASRHYFEGTNKKWYELWCQRDMSLQESAKVVVPELADRSQFGGSLLELLRKIRRIGSQFPELFKRRS